MKYLYLLLGLFTGLLFHSCLDFDRPALSFNNCSEACIAFEGEVYYMDNLEPAVDVRVELNKQRRGLTSSLDPRDEQAFANTDENGRFSFELSQLDLDPKEELVWLSATSFNIFDDGSNSSTFLISPDQQGKTIVQDIVVKRSKNVVLKLKRTEDPSGIIEVRTEVVADKLPVSNTRSFQPPLETDFVVRLSFPANLDAVMSAFIQLDDGRTKVISASVPSSFAAADTLTFLID